MPLNLHHPSAEVTSTHQVETRINRLEHKQFQDGVNAHFRGIQMSQSIQHLQHQLYQMQQTIAYDVPALRYQVQALEAKLDRKENEDCTRLIQLKPRSQEQKLQSAMRNANLTRIHSSVSYSDKTLEMSHLRQAEQMETLATSLRRRVHRGGAAYLLEAEDAEAWAAKLRKDAKYTAQPTIDNELSKNCDSEDWTKVVVPREATVTNAHQENETSHENLDDWQISPPCNTLNRDFPTAAQSASVKSSELHIHTSQCSRSPSLATSDPLWNTIDKAVAAAPQSISAKGSDVHSHAPKCPKSPSSSTSAVSIKIEQSSSPSNVSSVQVKAVPELQMKKLAPHLRYAAQQAQASKKPTPDQKIEVTTNNMTRTGKIINDSIIQTKEVTNVTQVQVPTMKVPPRHRKRNRAKAPSALESEAKAPNHEVEESPASGFVVPRAVSDVFKIEASPAQEEAISAKDTPSTTLKNDESISTLDLHTAPWQPSYLKDLPLLSSEELKDIPSSQEMHTFSRTFILNHLGGIKWLPSFYSVPHSELSLLPGRGFYLLEDTTEPLAPISPGHHGSLVTPIPLARIQQS
jgi:hypothetical protein